MNRLNAIVWPAIAQLAAEEVKELADKGYSPFQILVLMLEIQTRLTLYDT